MPYLHSVYCAFPKHYYDQEALIQGLLDHWSQRYFNPSRIAEFQRNVLVKGRHLALPLEEYARVTGFQARNDTWLRVALDLAEQAVTALLKQVGLYAQDVSLLASSTVTGITVPSLEARLMNRLPFATATKRLPLFGLGCLAGVAGLHRVADYLRGHPQEAAIFFTIELCSLTLQEEDLSVQNIISSGLFGDGGAAALVLGDAHPLAQHAPLELIAWRSAFFPETERAMGWDIVDSGFQVVLSKDVPDIVARELPGVVQDFLNDMGIEREGLTFFVAHPGGPKVLHTLEQVLQLTHGELQYSWDSLAEHGNMSSVSVLAVLAKTLESLPVTGSLGLLLAMGPAFCAELGVVRCQELEPL